MGDDLPTELNERGEEKEKEEDEEEEVVGEWLFAKE